MVYRTILIAKPRVWSNRLPHFKPNLFGFDKENIMISRKNMCFINSANFHGNTNVIIKYRTVMDKKS